MVENRNDTVLRDLITQERLRSYLDESRGDIGRAIDLYEWNAEAAAATLLTIGLVEVIVRNAMNRALMDLAESRGWPSWLDAVPLDRRGREDLRKARERATQFGMRPETHGKVVAELSLGFWRYLAASRYLTALWTPALFRSFPYGPADKRECQRDVDAHLSSLLVVRNRAAHHEPIHRRDLARDLHIAVLLSTWVHPDAGLWVADLSPLPSIVAIRPGA